MDNKIQKFIDKIEYIQNKYMNDFTNDERDDVYNTHITISVLGHTLVLDFGAVEFNMIVDALKENINDLT